MFNLTGSEIIFILLLALVVLGPEKLPSAVRRFTQAYAEFRRMGQGFQTELKSALDEPMREMRETADLLKESADPSRMMEQAERDAEAAVAAERSAESTIESSAEPSDDVPDDGPPGDEGDLDGGDEPGGDDGGPVVGSDTRPHLEVAPDDDGDGVDDDERSPRSA